MARISWTDEAQKWLREIYEYVARDNKEAAVKLVNSIRQKVKVLEDFPLLGHRLLGWPN